MLLVFTTFLILLAGISLVFFAKFLARPKLLEEKQPRKLSAENYRPLFEPTDDDLRQFETEEKSRLAANQSEELRQLVEERLAKFEKLRQTWRASATRANTIDLLYNASQTESGEIYLDTSEEVIKTWRAGILPDLTVNDLTQLLESHFWLLPAHERTPGLSFRIQREIAGLR